MASRSVSQQPPEGFSLPYSLQPSPLRPSFWIIVINTKTAFRPTTSAPPRQVRTCSKIALTSGQPNLSDTFFDNLTTFITAMISQLTDLRELHGRRIRHTLQDTTNHALPAHIKTPAIYIRLSELVPRAAAQCNSQRPWAKDFVQLIFRGAQRRRGRRRAKENEDFDIITEAKLSVTDKSKFSLLRGNVAPDVRFNPRRGQFALRLHVEAGKSVIDVLASRVQAIARLVGFVDAMRRSGKGTVCESVTLHEVVFAYGDGVSGSGSGSGTQQAAAPKQQQPPPPPPPWRVWLDLASGDKVDIKLQKKNPHLRILDRLKDLASSAQLMFLPSLLNLTLPLFRAVEAVEAAWEPVAMKDQGSVEIFHLSLDNLTIRYRLPSRPNQPRLLKLRLDMKVRRGERWWHLWQDSALHPESEFSKALKPVWGGRGADWRGLGSSAAARPAAGIEPMLAEVDKAILKLVGTPPPPPLRPQAALPRSNNNPAASASSSALAAASQQSARRISQASGGPSQPRSSQTMSQPNSQSQNNNNRTGPRAGSSVVVID